jgi:hypothetical protein
VLDAPCLLVLQAVLKIAVQGGILGGDPEEDVPVVAGAGERLP